jgi:protein-S-isoprenylcysteine O-methyltransferase Ste14
MAKSLNKSRMLASKLIVIGLLLCVYFSSSSIRVEGPAHEFFDGLGAIMVALCAMGRLYCSAFLGGFKNEKIVREGPYSVVRNPLYVLSWIGFTGIALMTNHVVLMIGVPAAFAIMYHFLVKREERFLLGKFGGEYRAFMNEVPRFIPNFAHYRAPETLLLVPKFLTKGFLDAVWWLAAYPIIEISEVLQAHGVTGPFFFLP